MAVMQILDGKTVSTLRRQILKPRVEGLTRRIQRPPHLVFVLVGDHGPSLTYVRSKEKACQEVGIRSTVVRLPAVLPQAALEGTIKKLNEDLEIDGILVQLPLPQGLKAEPIFELLNPLKDVDAFSLNAVGRLFSGQQMISPCTPQGIMNLLSHFQISVSGLHAVVVGRSPIVGKPMAMLLLQAQATVTMCHSKTKDLSTWTRQADLVIVAAGQKRFLGREDFKQGAIVVDVGIHGGGQTGEPLCGDVRFEELNGWVAAATPVPGGVGPMTITTLLENLVTLAEIRLGRV
jgi:methylenetetrahydrofolate dehydrogenase (NADP+)/methenyltetrahydrofolate cyclohydrolase